jgi:hypothetical protein
MNPQEMHIEIDQALQRVGSYVYDNFEAVELDLILNKMVMRYIDDKFRQDRMSEGFADEQGDLDDIQYLIEYDKSLPALLDTTFGKTYGMLPSDYLYLLNDRTRMNDNCNLDLTTSQPYIQENMLVLPFDDTTKVTAPFYDTMVITIGALTLLNQSIPIDDNCEKHLVKNEILDVINQSIREGILTGVKGIYWERYRNTYRKESFIIITDSTLVGQTGTLSIDGTDITATTTLIPSLTISNLPFTNEVDNRLVKSQFLPSNLFSNAYYKPNRRNPVSSLSKDRLHVYYDKKYIPTEILIDYVRMPQKISLSLNKSCELKEESHPKIIDLAVEYIKNTIEQRSYTTKVQDNQLRSE